MIFPSNLFGMAAELGLDFDILFLELLVGFQELLDC